MKLRIYDPKDLTQISELLYGDPEGRKKLELPVIIEKKHFQTSFWDICVIAEQEEKIKGFAFASFESASSTIHIRYLFVQKKDRKSGLGMQLYDHCLKLCMEQFNIVRLKLFTCSNPQMELFVKYLGFKNKGTYKDCIFCDGKFKAQTLWIKTLKK